MTKNYAKRSLQKQATTDMFHSPGSKSSKFHLI